MDGTDGVAGQVQAMNKTQREVAEILESLRGNLRLLNYISRAQSRKTEARRGSVTSHVCFFALYKQGTSLQYETGDRRDAKVRKRLDQGMMRSCSHALGCMSFAVECTR